MMYRRSSGVTFQSPDVFKKITVPEDDRRMTRQNELNAKSKNRPFKTIHAYVRGFIQLEPLATRIANVLSALPNEAQDDLMDDARFRLALDDYEPNQGRTVWMSCPEPGGNGSRCVVFKPILNSCYAEFAHYMIAHELAHAVLRNGSWEEFEDAEAAADALADHWGFPPVPWSA